jgi:hypothetical protein
MTRPRNAGRIVGRRRVACKRFPILRQERAFPGETIHTKCASWTAALLLMALASRSAPADTITAFGAGSWGASDAPVGVSGFVIENFEDSTLAPGLLVQVDAFLDFGPSGTLPFTFDPVANDPNALDVFNGGAWDGSRGIINRPIPMGVGYNDGHWGDVIFLIPGGATSFGFSLQQMEHPLAISVNGQPLADAPLALSSGRNGYLRIDADPGDPIYSVKLDNGAGGADGWMVDHVAFSPASAAVPLPSTVCGGLVLIAGHAALRRRSRRRPG